MSDTVTSIYDSLIKVQVELKAPKSQYNSFGRYNYRNVEDILEAVKPLLQDHGLTLIVSDELVNIGDRYYVRATAAVSGFGATVAANGFAREEETKKGMDGAQITGAASSYARKYALNGLFAIDDTKDADSDEHTAQSQQNAPSKPKPSPKLAEQEATPIQKRQIKALLTGLAIPDPEMAQFLEDEFGVIPGTPMLKVDAVKIITELEGGESEAAA